MALSVKPLKVGQEGYWLDQIARDHEEYFSGHGESPGRYVGLLPEQSGCTGEASAEQVRAMFRGQDPRTGAQRVAPVWRAGPRSKLPAAPALDALKARAAEQGVEDLEGLAGSKALAADVRAVQAAGRPGRAHKVKVETVERICRKVLGIDPHEMYGEAFDEAAKHQGKRVDAQVAAFDHCFSDPKSVSLLAAAGGDARRREVVAARDVGLQSALRCLQAHGVGVRRGHNGTERCRGAGVFAVAFDHRMSRAGEPDAHTHVLVQNATVGPDGRWTALDSDWLYAP